MYNTDVKQRQRGGRDLRMSLREEGESLLEGERRTLKALRERERAGGAFRERALGIRGSKRHLG